MYILLLLRSILFSQAHSDVGQVVHFHSLSNAGTSNKSLKLSVSWLGDPSREPTTYRDKLAWACLTGLVSNLRYCLTLHYCPTIRSSQLEAEPKVLYSHSLYTEMYQRQVTVYFQATISVAVLQSLAWPSPGVVPDTDMFQTVKTLFISLKQSLHVQIQSSCRQASGHIWQEVANPSLLLTMVWEFCDLAWPRSQLPSFIYGFAQLWTCGLPIYDLWQSKVREYLRCRLQCSNFDIIYSQ